MSQITIDLYAAHTGRKPASSITPRCFGHRGRAAPTTPPPAPETQATDLLAQAAKYEAEASPLLARAADLRAAAQRMTMTDAEIDAIESGCVDSDDSRHPNHPLHCSKPCCARSEP